MSNDTAREEAAPETHGEAGPEARGGVARRVGRWVLVLLVLAVVVGATWWAARATVPAAAPVAEQAAEPVLAEVVQADVGRSLTLNVAISQPVRTVAVNLLPGVVSAVGQTREVAVGEVVYAVAGIPVRAVQGTTPFFRDLAVGVSGEDVGQLTGALVALGYLGEPSTAFDARVEAAVRSWQRDGGTEETGTVRLGELVAVPSLPAQISLGEAIALGALVSQGEPAVQAPTGELTFQLNVGSDQAALIPGDAMITVPYQDVSWQAVIASATQDEFGQSVLTLTAPDGGPVCGQDCALLPAQERLTVMSQVHVVPQVSGPAVPAGAVRTDAQGEPYVVLADGSTRAVSVLGSSGGVAVVDGLAVGEQVMVSGDAAEGAAGAQTPDPSAPPSPGASG